MQRAVRRTLVWSLVFACGFTLIYLVTGKAVINLLTSLEQVRSTAYVYLPWLIAAPLVSVWCFLYDGVFVGATWPRAMRNVMVACTVLVFLPTWYFLVPSYGNHALWAAFLLFLGGRGAGMHFVYRRRARQMWLDESTTGASL
jgi:MATE family multidrug resistance protein